MNDGLGARRDHLRFEIKGQFWVSLDVRADITLRDITMQGALVETPNGRTWSALRTVTIKLRDDGPAVTGIVKHVSPAASDPTRQLVGLEFVHISPAALAELEQLVNHSTE